MINVIVKLRSMHVYKYKELDLELTLVGSFFGNSCLLMDEIKVFLFSCFLKNCCF